MKRVGSEERKVQEEDEERGGVGAAVVDQLERRICLFQKRK